MAKTRRKMQAEEVARQQIPLLEAAINVLGYQEEGEWVALALEMDLRGYGSSFEEAVGDLRDLVVMQIDFAHFKGQPELIWKPAEPHYWSLFSDLKRERLEALARGPLPASPREPELQAGSLPVPPPHVFAQRSSSYRQANG